MRKTYSFGMFLASSPSAKGYKMEETVTRVLLVDDDESTRASLQVLLESERCQVICAVNGADALAQLAVTEVDVVITDWCMPFLDGIELCKQLRGNPTIRQIPLLLVSSDPVPRCDGLWDAFFRKPVSFPDIFRAVRTLAATHVGVLAA
ncbi:response regulator [Caballeronia sp. BCC1704]|uniref:response regulator n=1 Tax=Caballeronia sp. BCC1704 TaxID=2676300 RepID=UPI001588592A|nr:response regulator [Caballeronia sp. BCC1704]